MKELLITIVKTLAEYPDEVSVNEIDRGGTVVFELTVAQDDLGRIIGKQGRIAKAIRSVMKAASIRENKRVIVDIL